MKLNLKNYTKDYFGLLHHQALTGFVGGLNKSTLTSLDPIKSKPVKYTAECIEMSFCIKEYNFDVLLSIIDGGMDTSDGWKIRMIGYLPNCVDGINRYHQIDTIATASLDGNYLLRMASTVMKHIESTL